MSDGVICLSRNFSAASCARSCSGHAHVRKVEEHHHQALVVILDLCRELGAVMVVLGASGSAF